MHLLYTVEGVVQNHMNKRSISNPRFFELCTYPWISTYIELIHHFVFNSIETVTLYTAVFIYFHILRHYI